MSYTTYIPTEQLRPYIASIAISEADEVREYKVLPGTGIVIGFQYKGRLAHINNGQETPLAASGLTGVQDTYRIFKNTAYTGTVLVYFKDGGASMFFKQPINEMYGESLSLDNFMLRSELAVMEEQLAKASSNNARIDITEQFLINRLRPTLPDAMVFAAINLVYRHKGNIKISDLIAQLHISQSPFEKRFRSVVGVSAKKFASIVRLKHLISDHKPATSLTKEAYTAGYYDQAHFIKEFRHFTGETPGEYFGRF